MTTPVEDRTTVARSDVATATLTAGFAAGLLDFAYFSAMSIAQGSSPVRVLRIIASFWLGASTPRFGGAALLGLATHFGLSVIMAAGFSAIWLKSAAARGRTAAAGLIYGAFLYAVMYLVVMPLRWPTVYPRFDGLRSVADVIIHIAFGLVIALVLKKHLSFQRRPSVALA